MLNWKASAEIISTDRREPLKSVEKMNLLCFGMCQMIPKTGKEKHFNSLDVRAVTESIQGYFYFHNFMLNLR